MNPRTKTLLTEAGAAVTLFAAALTVAGCGSGERNQSVPKAARDTGAAIVINNPAGFRNVAVKCFGVNGVYTTSRGDFASSGKNGPELPSSVAVVPNDPMCQPGRVPSSVQDNPATATPTR